MMKGLIHTDIFLHILTSSMIPIFFLISLGFILYKTLDLDITTLSKINFYLFVPGFAFVNLYTSRFSTELLLVILAALLILAVNGCLGALIPKIGRFDKGLTAAFQISLMFYNTGNIGVPLVLLAFADSPYLETALAAQLMVYLVQNLSINSLGFVIAGSTRMSTGHALIKVLQMPAVYAALLAFMLKTVPYDFTKMVIWPALVHVKDAMISVALVTLGVQLARTRFNFKSPLAYMSVLIRLVGGPLIAFFLVHLLGLEGVAAQIVVISSACPTAVNSALIAVQYDNYPDFAAQSVMLSTIFSAVTLTGVIYAADRFIPL
jgi:predicted permease